MSEYFTDREFGARPPSPETIDERVWLALQALIATRLDDEPLPKLSLPGALRAAVLAVFFGAAFFAAAFFAAAFLATAFFAGAFCALVFDAAAFFAGVVALFVALTAGEAQAQAGEGVALRQDEVDAGVAHAG